MARRWQAAEWSQLEGTRKALEWPLVGTRNGTRLIDGDPLPAAVDANLLEVRQLLDAVDVLQVLRVAEGLLAAEVLAEVAAEEKLRRQAEGGEARCGRVTGREESGVGRSQEESGGVGRSQRAAAWQ